jgi:hypothetical protein
MVRAVIVALLAAFVVWGVRVPPGRPFSWAMYSGSSKHFLFIERDGQLRVPTFEQLRLAPDSHYLVLGDVQALAAEPSTPRPLTGLIVGTRGSWEVRLGDREAGLSAKQLPPGEELPRLAEALRQLACPPP